MKVKYFTCVAMMLNISSVYANTYVVADTYASGQVTSLMAHGTNPAIRLTGNVSPVRCDAGTHGWLYFEGTPEERHRIYSTALALSLTSKVVTVYTNGDGTQCRINNIQIASGLN